MTRHNVHEDDERSQELGTGILAFDEIAGWVSGSVMDSTGMGR